MMLLILLPKTLLLKQNDTITHFTTMKKYIFQHCNTQQTKIIIARSEYKATTQNFGNLAGYKLIQTLSFQ